MVKQLQFRARAGMCVAALLPVVLFWPVSVIGQVDLLENGSFETWHPVAGQTWGVEEPDGWHGWEIVPWDPYGDGHILSIAISKDRNTGVPTPPVINGAHRAGMDEGWRSCYGGLYQEVTGLGTGFYTLCGWVSWQYGIGNPEHHYVEVIAKDGPHTPGAVPTGVATFSQDGSRSQAGWEWFEANVECTSGTLTVYANLRSDRWDGYTFLHFDGFGLFATGPVGFMNFQAMRTVNGSAYDVTITYDTIAPVTTQIEWGPTEAYGSTTAFDSNELTQHIVTLTGIPPATEPYHYRALATSPLGVDACSSDQTFEAPAVTVGGVSSAVDPTTGSGATIGWVSSVETTSNRVFCRSVGEPAWLATAAQNDPDPATSHTVTLAGLAVDTEYEFYVESSGADLLTATSGVRTFRTPVQPRGRPLYLTMTMVGGSWADGDGDVGPANEVKRMVHRDHPEVNLTGIPATAWFRAQPDDPGAGPDVYDWSSIDSQAAGVLPGKSLLSYYQMWGTSPGWVVEDTPHFWQKFEAFIEEMTVHINENFGAVYYVFENEPDISRAPVGWYWMDWYIHCLQHFYVAVHRADARTGMVNGVVGGNLSGHVAYNFDGLYARGLKNSCDLLGYHPYAYDIRAGLDVADLALIHATQVAYGDGDKRIWVSEGWGGSRGAGFERSSPLLDPPAQEIENMYLALVNGWDNVMTPRENWHPDYLWGMSFFCGNDNWGAVTWRRRAIPQKDAQGNIIGFILDGYWMAPDVGPAFWNGGLIDFYGNSKDCLLHVYPGDGLVFMNPGFELRSEPPNPHLPHFWMPDTNPTLASEYELDDSMLHGGGSSLKLTRTDEGSHGVFQVTAKRSVIGGESYRSRIRCRTGNGNAAGRFYMCFTDLAGTSKTTQTWATDVLNAADWQSMQVIAAAPAWAQRVEVGCSINGIGSVWFDDVTISLAQHDETGPVRGYTLDEEQRPVPWCIVRSTTGGLQALSDEKGYYEIADVPTGTYDFVCRKAGYVPHRVHNQTIASNRVTFLSFSMALPKPGLTVTQIDCDADTLMPEAASAGVSVTVTNSMPYPIMVSEVNLFIEQAGLDTTDRFTIHPSELNPEVIDAAGSATFNFTLSAHAEAAGGIFELNAYAYGQEDRPNLIANGGFDGDPWNLHWSFSGSAPSLTWEFDSNDSFSPPGSLRCFVSGDSYTWNWANNHSISGSGAVPAKSGQKYTLGVHHKDDIVGGVSVELFIQEYHYDGANLLANGRRLSPVPHRSVWGHDLIVYETGDPNVTPGLYETNRLVVSCGPATTPNAGSGYNWWDDLYLKETGDWLADDRADAGPSLAITPTADTVAPDFDGDGDVDQEDFGKFQACLSGRTVPQLDPACLSSRFDDDIDVDESDYLIFMACMSGADLPADPTCAN